MPLGTAIRDLADFLESPDITYSKELHPICQNTDWSAFNWNTKFGCRLTGTVGIAILTPKGWIVSQDGIVNPAAKFDDNLIVK